MAPAKRNQSRRPRRPPERDGRAEKAAEAQQAAYQAARKVLGESASRRDAAWRQSARANRRRGALVLATPVAVLTAILVVVAIFSSILWIAAIAVAVAGGATAALVWHRSSAILSRRLGGVPVEVSPAGRQPGIKPVDAARLIDVTEGLCAALGIRRCEVRVLEDPCANAISFGAGPDNGTVLLTSGLVAVLDRIELEAVLAHELAHLKSGDTSTGAVAALVAMWLGGVLPFVRSRSASLAGREREPLADLAAVGATRYPPGLASALDKLAGSARRPTSLPRQLTDATSGLWLAPFEDRPLVGSVHPGALDLEDRIAALREL